MLKKIKDHPYLRECFSDYLGWLFHGCNEARREYDPVYMKVSSGYGLDALEDDFRQAGETLGLNESEFCKIFRLNCDRNKNEVLKVGDLLAEPWVAVALKESGFQLIRKVSKNNGKFADLIAEYGSRKFAIEVKNIRTDPNYHKWLVDTLHAERNSLISAYNPDGRDLLHKEEDILTQALEKKLCSEERKKIEAQLRNTAKVHKCKETMLVLYLEAFILGEFPNAISTCLDEARTKFSFCGIWTKLPLCLKLILKRPVVNYLGCCINNKIVYSPSLS